MRLWGTALFGWWGEAAWWWVVHSRCVYRCDTDSNSTLQADACVSGHGVVITTRLLLVHGGGGVWTSHEPPRHQSPSCRGTLLYEGW